MEASDVSAEPARKARTCTPEWKVDVVSPLRVSLSLQRRSLRAVRLEDGYTGIGVSFFAHVR
jgi:hypothetical protein